MKDRQYELTQNRDYAQRLRFRGLCVVDISRVEFDVGVDGGRCEFRGSFG